MPHDAQSQLQAHMSLLPPWDLESKTDPTHSPTSVPSHRPYIFANMAMSADGKITGSLKGPPTFTSKIDFERLHLLRAWADAVLVGAQTLRTDNISLQCRIGFLQEIRQRLKLPPHLSVVVVSASADLSAVDAPLGQDVPVVVCTTAEPPAKEAQKHQDNCKRLKARGFEVWQAGQNGSIDLAIHLQKLRHLGCKRLLLEGGATLNGAMLELDALDAFYLTIAPSILGGSHTKTPFGGVGRAQKDKMDLSLEASFSIGSEIFMHYTVCHSNM